MPIVLCLETGGLRGACVESNSEDLGRGTVRCSAFLPFLASTYDQRTRGERRHTRIDPVQWLCKANIATTNTSL